MADREPKEPCCDGWREAHRSGSDNEEYGALVYQAMDGIDHIGAACLPHPKFCPWCGAKKRPGLTSADQRKYDDLPRGARFRYVGHPDYGVWVKLEDGGTGVIAKWGDGVGWRQSICSLCETEDERKNFVVEVVE